jgi:hypothetical protein
VHLEIYGKGAGMESSRVSTDGHGSSIEALRWLPTSERLLALYECGLDGCAERDEEKVGSVLRELIGLLDLQYGEIAESFHRIYTFCLQRAHEGQFDQVGWFLRDLHDTWAQPAAEVAARPALAGGV